MRYGRADLIYYSFNVTEEIADIKLKTYSDALMSKDKNKWLTAMHEEMNSLYKNSTWILVNRPKGEKTVGCKWIFKSKEGVPGVKKARFKAGLVAKGFTQIEV